MQKLFYITQTTEGFFESKGSKFLAYLIPLYTQDSLLESMTDTNPSNYIATQENNCHKQINEIIESLKLTHPKAVHFVNAARILNQHKQIIESCSDDGEPKGSSGTPCLNVLRGENLINTCCVVVRYFGGTLLGVGGLVRAYTQAVQESVKKAKDSHVLTPFVQKQSMRLFVPYALFSKFEHQATMLDVHIDKQSFNEKGIEILCYGMQKYLDILKNKL